jgi:hypothetical protein
MALLANMSEKMVQKYQVKSGDAMYLGYWNEQGHKVVKLTADNDEEFTALLQKYIVPPVCELLRTQDPELYDLYIRCIPEKYRAFEAWCTAAVNFDRFRDKHHDHTDHFDGLGAAIPFDKHQRGGIGFTGLVKDKKDRRKKYRLFNALDVKLRPGDVLLFNSNRLEHYSLFPSKGSRKVALFFNKNVYLDKAYHN